jgi:hypothetical protein
MENSTGASFRREGSLNEEKVNRAGAETPLFFHLLLQIVGRQVAAEACISASKTG